MNTYFKHTIIYFISKGLPGALTFLAILYYSDKLDPSEYGIYSLIISAVGILNIIGFDWFRFGVARFLPEYVASNKRDEFISFINSKVQVTIVIVFIITLIVYLFFPFFPDIGIARWMIPVVSILTILQYLFILYSRVIITELMPNIFMKANFIKAIFGVLLSVFLVYSGWGFKGLIIGLGAGLIFSVSFLCYKIKFPKPLFNLSLDRDLLKQIALYSLPLAASASLSFILSYSNRFIINYYRGVNETGLFSLGFDFSQQTVGVFISIAATSAFPIAMKLYSESGNTTELKRHMSNSLLLLCTISLPIVAVFAANSVDISTLLLGSKFSSMDNLVIPIISLNTFILGIKAFYFDLYFYLRKETKYQLIILLFVASLNVALNLIFVPRYGYIAAIWAGLVTSLVAVISTFFVTRRLLPIPLDYKALVKVFSVGFLMFVVMKVLGNSSSIGFFIVKLIIGGVVYITLIALINKKVILQLLKSKFKK